MSDLVPVRRALLSVSDKSGLLAFAGALAAKGVELISTGGTATALRSAGLAVTSVESVTGFPEMLDGRVKTLHPMVHGGLLGVTSDPAHAAQMKAHAIAPIDLVCVSLYPFEQTASRAGDSPGEVIEQIDIGGPAMIRSGAKNHARVAVITSPAQHARVLDELTRLDGRTSASLRADLAREAFALTARYDLAIAGYLAGPRAEEGFPPLLTLSYVRAEELRYGENPHQSAVLYRTPGRPVAGSVAFAEQVHGKDLSYNNLLDAQAALSLAWSLREMDAGLCGAAIVKHTNPCGAAVASDVLGAIDAALAGDPVAAYGGILAVSETFDLAGAQRLQSKDVFLEVILAPAFSAPALAALRARWANVRLLATGFPAPGESSGPDLRSIPGGLLAQRRDTHRATEFVHRAGPRPDEHTLRVARFLEPVARSLLSNAVCLGRREPAPDDAGGVLRLLGAGAGQMDRVTSCRLAVEKAGALARGGVAFSDAFFPFPDGPRVLIDAGVAAIIHPGGSKRDQETFDLCQERGVTCLTTGVRHFRH